jgi:hypothetical protein
MNHAVPQNITVYVTFDYIKITGYIILILQCGEHKDVRLQFGKF